VAASDAGAGTGNGEAGNADARDTKAGNTNAASKVELGRFGSPV
jgi:hypothetical protein